MVDVSKGEKNLKIDFNDAVSSIKVTRGCKLKAYENYDLQKLMFTANSNMDTLGHYDDKLSSFDCQCSKYFVVMKELIYVQQNQIG